MNIFKKRPLSLILCITLGGFSLFANLSIAEKLLISGVVLTLLAITFVFKNKFEGRIKFVRLCALLFAISILLSALWSVLFYPMKYYDKNVKIEGRIYEINTSSYSANVIIETDKISDKRDRHTLILYTDTNTAIPFRKYDVVTLSATVKNFGEGSDAFTGKSYYIGKGISAYLENAEEICILENSPDKLDRFLDNATLKLSNALKKRTNFETGAFLSALIIGNREDLDGNTRLNFSRAGISHILALSGMHLAILSAAITKVLSLLKMNKKYRVIVVSVLTFIYMALTGFAPSVFRAGVMLIITGILYLLSSTHDSITSLFIALAVIVICSPYSVFDISLWLSAFATLGVIVFSESYIASEKEENITILKSILLSLRDGILISVFAFAATFAISAFNFNAFSVVSLFTTLFFATLIQIFIYLGLISLAIGWLIPVGRLIIVLSDFIKQIAEFIGDIKFVYVSSESFVTSLFICVFTLFFFAFLILDTDKKKICVLIICSLLTSTFAAALIDNTLIRYSDDIVYSPDTTGDTLFIKSDGNASAIYSGKATIDASFGVVDFLVSERTTYLDRLILPTYTYNTIQFSENIISTIKTHTIYVPIPDTKDEIAFAEGLSDMLSLYGTNLRFYESGEQIKIGECYYKLIDRVPHKYGVSPMNVFKFYSSGNSYIYVSSGEYEYVNADAKAELYNCEILILGTANKTNLHYFNMILPNVEAIYSANTDFLTEYAEEYYDNLINITDAESIMRPNN